jgi:biopolymer transport protein ExbB
MKRFLPGLFLSLFAVLSSAQDSTPVVDETSAYRDAAASIDEDLRTALDELAKVRAAIALEKPALAAESNQIAAELREQRRRYDLARVTREEAESEFEKTGITLKIWKDEKQYIESLFLDFQKTRLATGGPFRPDPAQLSLADLSSQLALIDSVLAEVGSESAVQTIPGEAVTGNGTIAPGTFVKAGPVLWFLGEQRKESGLVTEGPDLLPLLVDAGIPPESIEALLQGGTSSIAFDPTLGSAIALQESESSLLEHIQQGGFWIYPILLLAAIALIAALLKWIQLSKIREFGAGEVQHIIDALHRREAGEARAIAERIHHPARELLNRGIDEIERSPNASRDDIEEALFEKFLEATPPLQRGLPLIAIASATAPLLGLLGTVTGMIETFRLINVFGTGDAKSLASGISEALVTTEFGLIVAIPALILHALLSRKVQGIKASLEMTSLAFLNGIKGK